MVKPISLTLVLSVLVGIFGCRNSATTRRIQFVDRDTVASHTITPQPLMLIVEIDEAGGLRLNKIETGTMRDMSLLAEKLEVVFADREKSGIDEREVVIDMKIDLEAEDFDELIGTLADLQASPIRIIKNDQ